MLETAVKNSDIFPLFMHAFKIKYVNLSLSCFFGDHDNEHEPRGPNEEAVFKFHWELRRVA